MPVTGEKEPRARSLALGRWSGGKARGGCRRIKRGRERNNEAQVSRATTAQQMHLLPSLEEVRPRGNDCLLIGEVALGRPWGGYIGTRVGGSPAAVPVRSAFGRDYIPDHRQSLSGPLHSICTAALSYLFPSKSRPRPPLPSYSSSSNSSTTISTSNHHGTTPTPVGATARHKRAGYHERSSEHPLLSTLVYFVS